MSMRDFMTRMLNTPVAATGIRRVRSQPIAECVTSRLQVLWTGATLRLGDGYLNDAAGHHVTEQTATNAQDQGAMPLDQHSEGGLVALLDKAVQQDAIAVVLAGSRLNPGADVMDQSR